jgi:hypothetical protein
MLFIFLTPVLIRHLWKLNTVVFLHWCLIHAVLLMFERIIYSFHGSKLTKSVKKKVSKTQMMTRKYG